MVRTSAAQTLGLSVYEQLRSAILDGRYRPGERLRLTELCAAYGVSPGVLREAVRRLAEQRLVTIEHNRGYRVTTISSKQIHDLVELRRINEGAALRLSLQRGTAAWEGEVLAAHHRLKSMRSAMRTDLDAWSVAHIEYHMSLLSACGNDRLLELCQELFTASELYRRWSEPRAAQAPRPDGEKRDTSLEHAQILEAVLDHDTDLAVARYEAHLNRTAEMAQLFTDTPAVTSQAPVDSSGAGGRETSARSG
ncbi:MAG TPA: GntR family transcriptional regulator [Trebonia sp.]|nr:GntR family transcriptional regulator [Trebonia sp.]